MAARRSIFFATLALAACSDELDPNRPKTVKEHLAAASSSKDSIHRSDGQDKLVFQVMDADADGRLSSQEFSTAAQRFAKKRADANDTPQASEARFEALFDNLDDDGDGFLDRQEARGLWKFMVGREDVPVHRRKNAAHSRDEL